MQNFLFHPVKTEKINTVNKAQEYGLYKAELIEGAKILYVSAALKETYQAAKTICQGRIKNTVQTAQSIRFARLAGERLNFSPIGRTSDGPTKSSAGAFAEIGIEANIVIPTIKISA